MREFLFTARQVVLVGLAVFGYFGVRGLTEGNVDGANRNAERVLRFESILGLDLELKIQEAVLGNDVLVTLANWIYIWGHWPVVIATLVWLAVTRRTDFFELRNAMFISGAIGLVIYTSYAVSPPRLFGADYIDTVTERSVSYRVLQPPGLVNKYAAVPSLHFGWNLLVGISWLKVSNNRFSTFAAITMPAAMAFAVVATANHWTFDVIAGGVVALVGLAMARAADRYVQNRGHGVRETDGADPLEHCTDDNIGSIVESNHRRVSGERTEVDGYAAIPHSLASTVRDRSRSVGQLPHQRRVHKRWRSQRGRASSSGQ